MDDLIRNIAVYALPVLFAITLHEAAHAYAARFFGDNTAYAAGRMSLNPLKHVDPFGTIVLPLVIYLGSQGTALFGYAKPVPVDFDRLKNPRRDMAWVALAGPGANFFMALMWLVFGVLLTFFDVSEPFPHRVARAGILANLLMFAFNLLPIPPLDGGRVLTSILPKKLAFQFARLEPYGMFILLGLVLLSGFGIVSIFAYWVFPVMTLAEFALHVIASPLDLLLH